MEKYNHIMLKFYKILLSIITNQLAIEVFVLLLCTVLYCITVEYKLLHLTSIWLLYCVWLYNDDFKLSSPTAHILQQRVACKVTLSSNFQKPSDPLQNSPAESDSLLNSATVQGRSFSGP